MYDFERFYCQRIENMDYDGLKRRINGRKAYIWGADKKGKYLYENMRRNGINISGFLDVNREKYETDEIFEPSEIVNVNNRENVYIIISMYLKHEKEILSFLKEALFTEEDYYYPYKDWSFVYSDVCKRFDYSINPLYIRGKERANSLERNKFYFLLYGGHIGDEIIALSWLDGFRKRHLISRLTVITSKTYSSLAALYSDDFEEIEVWEKEDLEALRIYSLSVNRNIYNVVGANWVWFPRERGIPFAMNQIVYKTMHLGLPFSEKSKYFVKGDKGKEELFIKLGLKREKSIILIPYAQTAAGFSNLFWEELVECLSEKYEVFTNVAKDEQPIKKTKALSLPLDEVPYAVDFVKAAISIRCGLVDILALGQCNNTLVLYNTDSEYEKEYADINSLYINGEESILYKNAIYSNNYSTKKEFINEICRRLMVND